MAQWDEMVDKNFGVPFSEVHASCPKCGGWVKGRECNHCGPLPKRDK